MSTFSSTFRADRVYDAAVARAKKDHRKLVEDFLEDKIDTVPDARELEREYVIKDFNAYFVLLEGTK